MKIHETIKTLTPFERGLWLTSVIVITGAYLITGNGGGTELAASLIGVTALIFVAKGMAAGQVLTVVFALFYGYISLKARYYGEMLTYLGMTAPIAAAAVVSWLRHPYKGTNVVEVAPLSPKKFTLLTGLALAVTAVSYFALRYLGCASLFFSTVSVFTSFMASGLTFLRSPFYAIGYSANDVVLIVLWCIAARTDPTALPMVFCFIMFLANDIYGFFNWKRLNIS
ncbi:nicotinamide riboside transporter PnuC [Ruminococcus sp.]|uniref:nicotinamide riboside transporter PnuC n=1 Tax=Ruminococcus sp. TaxID=41978 RepID=UPI0025CED21D|nr:nicotinamide riboside transporter PnuC [Ruminococcus sp.]MBQ8966188.1 nicotinamide mononucleotide transporter [Ruminococcus sp.]